jgi:hypothetical protein
MRVVASSAFRCCRDSLSRASLTETERMGAFMIFWTSAIIFGLMPDRLCKSLGIFALYAHRELCASRIIVGLLSGSDII